MFSWLNVPSDVPLPPPIDPPANVIFPCISSSKLADGVPTTTPSVVMGHGPLNVDWKLTMSSWLSMAILLFVRRHSSLFCFCRRGKCRRILSDKLLHAQRPLPRQREHVVRHPVEAPCAMRLVSQSPDPGS